MIFKRVLFYLFSHFINYDSISEMFPVSVKSLVLDDNRILLIKNERDDWDLPGGKVEKNDSVMETLNREINEELNLEIENHKILHVDKYIFRKQEIIVVIYCSDIATDDPIKISFENLDYNFFTYRELNNLKLTPWAKDGINKFYNQS